MRLRAPAGGIAYDDVRPRENGAAVAQKVQTLFIDDLDGSAADGTVRFSLDGTDYEIDLNSDHAQALRDALARYISAARRAGSGTRRPVRSGRKAPANGVSTKRDPRVGQGAGHRGKGPRPGTRRARRQVQSGHHELARNPSPPAFRLSPRGIKSPRGRLRCQIIPGYRPCPAGTSWYRRGNAGGFRGRSPECAVGAAARPEARSGTQQQARHGRHRAR